MTELNRFECGVIKTIRPEGAKGIKMPVEVYDRVLAIILHELASSSHHTLITLIETLTKVCSDIPDLSFFALHVKLDLEARGFIKNNIADTDPGQLQKCLRLTKKGQEYYNDRIESIRNRKVPSNSSSI